MADTYQILRSEGGTIGNSLAEAFESFPWRKGHWCVRAILQNSATLKPFSYSFRNWLKYECSLLGVHDYPPDDFLCKVYLQRGKNLNLVSLEQALCTRLEQQFYRVGPEMALYMLCDWQLWLWMEGKTGIFHNFKSDSFHQAFAKKYGAGIVPLGKHDFAAWWCQHKECEKIPPRLANECIWLGMAYKDV